MNLNEQSQDANSQGDNQDNNRESDEEDSVDFAGLTNGEINIKEDMVKRAQRTMYGVNNSGMTQGSSNGFYANTTRNGPFRTPMAKRNESVSYNSDLVS